MKDKDQIARELALAHHAIEPSIVSVFRITSDEDSNPAEPIKLLEVNPETPPSGIVPVALGATERVPFPSVVVEVTPEEFELIRSHRLALPDGWLVGEPLLNGAEVPLDAAR